MSWFQKLEYAHNSVLRKPGYSTLSTLDRNLDNCINNNNHFQSDVQYLVYYQFIIILSKANMNPSSSNWKHTYKYMCVNAKWTYLCTAPGTLAQGQQLLLLRNWEENNSKSSKIFSNFFSFARWSVKHKPGDGSDPLRVMTQCVEPHFMKEEPTTLFTDTHFVTWHCQAIFLLYRTLLSKASYMACNQF